MRSRVCLLLLAAALAAVAFAPPARADGDPGSDVLVYQPLFLAAGAGVSLPEQVRLGGLLRAAARSGFPVRVAIIAAPSDLGATDDSAGDAHSFLTYAFAGQYDSQGTLDSDIQTFAFGS